MTGEMIIVSACLVGVRCVNYPSCSLEDEVVKRLFVEGRAVPLCPEQIGGLPTPRPPVGFSGGTAEELWTGSAKHVVRMVSTAGDDFTEQFLGGCQQVLRLAQLAGANTAILHDGSPSCGTTWTSVYDSEGQLVHEAGCGVLAWLLNANGIHVYSAESWKSEQGSDGPG
jgi:uncharacterized protein YbbK (DUF523 family)